MAIEKRWVAVGPVAVTAPGTASGGLTVSSTSGLKVKMQIQLNDPVQPTLALEIKRVDSSTVIEVGLPGASIRNRVDVSAYGAASSVFAPEQPRNAIPLQEIERAIYEEEPTVAQRVVLVDPYGNPYSASGGGSSSTTIKDGSTSNLLQVYSDGSVKTVQLFNKPYDAIAVAYPTTSQETYASYLGGLAGTLQQTVTVNYVDATKTNLVSVVRT